jgi:hypothetical protein
VTPAAKIAVTLFAVLIVTEQEALLPLHAPPQPENVDPEVGAAVSVTLDPPEKDALHVVPQFSPVGADITVPLPVPDLLTESEYVVPAGFSH